MRKFWSEAWKHTRWQWWFTLYLLPICMVAVSVDMWVNGVQSEPSWISWVIAIPGAGFALWAALRTIERRDKRRTQ